MSRSLPFVELEFVHAIGPDPGRYVVALGEETGESDVLQITVVSAQTTQRGLRRRTRDVTGADTPAEVPVLRVMWIGANQSAGTQGESAARLQRLREAEDEREELVTAVIDVLNVAVRAHRAAARDPYVMEVTRADPRSVRFGYGDPRDLTRGRWTEAFLAPPPRMPKVDRAMRLGPSETVALALRGNLDLLEAEELVLRGLLDIEQERWRAGAAQLHAAAVVLRAELDGARERGAAIVEDDEDLVAREDRLGMLRDLALADELDEVAQGELRAHANSLGDTLDIWRAPA